MNLTKLLKKEKITDLFIEKIIIDFENYFSEEEYHKDEFLTEILYELENFKRVRKSFKI